MGGGGGGIFKTKDKKTDNYLGKTWKKAKED